jgi:hypothetical protein
MASRSSMGVGFVPPKWHQTSASGIGAEQLFQTLFSHFHIQKRNFFVTHSF